MLIGRYYIIMKNLRRGDMDPKVAEMYPYMTRDEKIRSMKNGNFVATYLSDPQFKRYCNWLCNCANGGGERGD